MLTLLHTFTGHQNPVYTLSNSDKTGIFFSAGNDKGVVEWSLNKMAFIMVKMPVQSSVYALHNYNDQMFVGERSGAFSVFDFMEQKVIARITAHHKGIFSIKTLASKNELLTTGEDGDVAIWSLTDFQEKYRFPIAADTVRAIAVSPDEREIAFACKDHSIKIYHAADFSLKQTLTAHTHPVTSITYHPQGNYLISGGRDAQLHIWGLPSYSLIKSIPAHLFAVYDIAFHPELALFATASQDKSIKLWDANNFKLYKILSLDKTGTGHTHSINKVIWSKDGSKLISTGDDRKVIVWELEA